MIQNQQEKDKDKIGLGTYDQEKYQDLKRQRNSDVCWIDESISI